MAKYIRELNTSYNFDNIDIINVLNDGTLSFYEAVPHEGYVLYDTEGEYPIVIDPETGEESVELQYFTSVAFPLMYNFNNFSWIAVLRSEVPASDMA